jgi:serine protease Do
VSDTQDLESFALAPDDTLAQGQRVVTLGYPGNFSDQPTLQTTDGQISAMGVDWTDGGYPDLIQHTATINHGNSGGPLVDLEGRLVGVNTLTNLEDSQGQPIQDQYYAIPGSRIREVVPTLNEGTSIARDGIGPLNLGEIPITSDTGTARKIFPILNVQQGSPAEGIGLSSLQTNEATGELSGWAILSVNGTPITNRLDYCNAIRDMRPSDTLNYRVEQFRLNPDTGAFVNARAVIKQITFY